MPLIAPSVLAANFANLQRDIEMVNISDADLFHVDIMDGVFVPNISFGLPVCKAIQKYAAKPLDVHLMIVQPEKYIAAFHDAGAEWMSVHLEACPHLHSTIYQIKKLGIKAGVAINPHTPISSLEDIIKDIDFVNVMSVNPGFGGQKFIEHTYEKLTRLRQLIKDTESSAMIEIDGGVSFDNYQQIIDAEVEIIVAGNMVFSHKDPSMA
ncbi:MAG: ribulose-phosphate 3-epimerase, partial [Cytophagales bacterium]|nr:ribulose-phosphate 3-epimerase [Cytophagales bacterium]